MLDQNDVQKTKKGNMYKSSIKQWNPFAGCKFDCTYCEASFKRQAKRQKNSCMDCYNYTPHTHPERLTAYLPKTSEDEFIFTCASADVSFCPTPFLKKIIKRIEENPSKTFVLQSKNPKTFNRVKIPDNVMLAITLETNRDRGYDKVSKAPKPTQRIKDFMEINHSRKMITIEPVMDFDFDIMFKWIQQVKPQLVWMGYDSKSKDLLPEPNTDKFWRLHDAIEQIGIKVEPKTIR